MNLSQMFSGEVYMEITSADPAMLLRRITDTGIPLYEITQLDDLTMHAFCDEHKFISTKELIEQYGGKVVNAKFYGLHQKLKTLMGRPVFLLGITILIILSIILPNRILFVRVEGNEQIQTKQIIEKAEQCGIGFMSSRRSVRSEQAKNLLLAALPELQWAGINTSGCVATIQVKEKSTDDIENNYAVRSIVASRDGVIVSCTPNKGNVLCQVGEAVKEGQTLVSAYTDNGLFVETTVADAEIIAQTYRQLCAISPTARMIRTYTAVQNTKYSLLVGKKLINFYKDSGISDSRCVKMYEEKYLTLPGGFQLPVALVIEKQIYCEVEQSVASSTVGLCDMGSFTQKYLKEQMISGQILESEESLQIMNGFCRLDGNYLCLEMIGKAKNEVDIEKYGKEY